MCHEAKWNKLKVKSNKILAKVIAKTIKGWLISESRTNPSL